MSQKAPKTKTYKVTTDGVINIRGMLKRDGDTVSLTDSEAASYAAHISKRPITETKTETKNQGKAK